MTGALLEIETLSCGYGDRPVLDGVTLSVREGEAVLLANLGQLTQIGSCSRGKD